MSQKPLANEYWLDSGGWWSRSIRYRLIPILFICTKRQHFSVMSLYGIIVASHLHTCESSTLLKVNGCGISSGYQSTGNVRVISSGKLIFILNANVCAIQLNKSSDTYTYITSVQWYQGIHHQSYPLWPHMKHMI